MTDFPITVTVNPEPLPEKWGLSDTIDLARDLAVDHSPEQLAHIIRRHGLTEAQFAGIVKHPVFVSVFETQQKEWGSIKSTPDRLRLRGQLGVESALPKLVNRISDPHEQIAGVAQLTKVLVDMAGLSKPEQASANPGERITINIDLGGDTKLVYDKQIGAQASPMAEGDKEIHGDAERTSDAAPIPALPAPTDIGS